MEGKSAFLRSAEYFYPGHPQSAMWGATGGGDDIGADSTIKAPAKSHFWPIDTVLFQHLYQNVYSQGSLPPRHC
jgi:hypothetical protein